MKKIIMILLVLASSATALNASLRCKMRADGSRLTSEVWENDNKHMAVIICGGEDKVESFEESKADKRARFIAEMRKELEQKRQVAEQHQQIVPEETQMSRSAARERLKREYKQWGFTGLEARR